MLSTEVWVELLDGILMPVAVGFLYLLAISPVLPEIVRAPGIPTGGVYHVKEWQVIAGLYGLWT